MKYVRTVTVTTIYACYITIDLYRRHCHVPFFFFFFKGLAQLALCHVLDQKLYDIGWFSHRRRNSTCGRRSLNTGANVSSSAVGSTLCSSLPFPSLLLSSLLFRPISLCWNHEISWESTSFAASLDTCIIIGRKSVSKREAFKQP